MSSTSCGISEARQDTREWCSCSTVSMRLISTAETGIRASMSESPKEHSTRPWMRSQSMQQGWKTIWTSSIWMYGTRMPGRPEGSLSRSILSDGDSRQSSRTRASMTPHGPTGRQTRLTAAIPQRDTTVRSSVSSAMTRETSRSSTTRPSAARQTIRFSADSGCTASKAGAATRISTSISEKHLQRTFRRSSCSTTM